MLEMSANTAFITTLALVSCVSSFATNTNLTPSSDFVSAMQNASAGDTLFFAAGTYRVAYTAGSKNTITLKKTGTAAKPIVFYAKGHAKAIIDFLFPELTYVQDSYGLSMTGSYYELHGIGITHAGYQGAYVTGSYNSFYNCAFFENRNSGLEINKGGNHTLVVNVDSYRNYDPKKKGGMADGFASKQTQGAGNVFKGCRAWENSDDGFDFFDSPDSVIVYDSWTFRNGINVFGYADSLWDVNGNGFKMGGNSKQANHRCTRCVAFDNLSKGFDQNNNTGGVTVEQSIGYRNGINFGLGGTLNDGQKHHFRNNVSYKGKSSDSFTSGSEQTNNAWTLSISVANSDFVSLDTSLARSRDEDGNISTGNLFRLSANSKLIDKGKNIGYDYYGSAPDLGPFEYGATSSSSSAASSSSVAVSSSSVASSSSAIPSSSSIAKISSSSTAESSSSAEQPSSSSAVNPGSSSSVVTPGSSSSVINPASSSSVVNPASSSSVVIPGSTGDLAESSSSEAVIESSGSEAISRAARPRTTGLNTREVRYFNALGKSAKGSERYRVIFGK